MHVELLFKAGNGLSIYIVTVNAETHVEQVEAAQEIADTATAVEVISASEDDIFYFEGFRGGNDADHAVGNGNAVVVGRIDLGGGDLPGILGEGGNGQECKKGEDDEYVFHKWHCK